MNHLPLDEIDSLDNLFKVWQNAHETECPESCSRTIPKPTKEELPSIAQHNFIADGCICKKKHTSTYLYVLKEANQYGNEDKKPICEHKISDFDSVNIVNSINIVNYSAMKGFWRTDRPQARRNLTKMCNLFKIINSIEDFKKDNSIKSYDLAIMNINKRGGYSSCDHNALKEYSCQYMEFIMREIELIDPTYVICANQVFDYLKCIYSNHSKYKVVECGVNIFCLEDKTMKFYKWFHPAASKRYEDFKNKFHL